MSSTDDESDSSQRRSWLLAAARYSAIAFMLPACTFVGWLIGAALDRWLHKTWLYIPGLLFGIIAGFVELIRTVAGSQSQR